MRKWKYEDEMAFLVPHLTERKSYTSDVYVSDFECTFSDDDRKAVESAATTTNTEDDSSQSSKERTAQSKQNATSESDEVVDAFFASISRTVKTFNPYLQNIAKSKVFAVISELELEQIKQRDTQFIQCIASSAENTELVVKEEILS